MERGLRAAVRRPNRRHRAARFGVVTLLRRPGRSSRSLRPKGYPESLSCRRANRSRLALRLGPGRGDAAPGMPMKKVAILQSNYIPWKGYFDLIAAVDEFILYDDVQFTKNDWRNRNKIKTPKGLEWISIPVGQDISRRIRDVELPDHRWQEKHWKTLEANYGRAPHFAEVARLFEPLYLQRNHSHLSALNREFIEVICRYLGLSTRTSKSWD